MFQKTFLCINNALLTSNHGCQLLKELRAVTDVYGLEGSSKVRMILTLAWVVLEVYCIWLDLALFFSVAACFWNPL